MKDNQAEIKYTFKMQHNLAEIDLYKILHDLKCPNLAYDTIVGWGKHWNSNSSSSYEFKKCDQLHNDLAIRYDTNNTLVEYYLQV